MSDNKDIKFTPSNLSWDELNDDLEEEVKVTASSVKEAQTKEQSITTSENNDINNIDKLLTKLNISEKTLKDNKLKLILIEDNSEKVEIKELTNKLIGSDKADTKVNIKNDNIAFVKFDKEEKEVKKEVNDKKCWNNKSSFSSRNHNRSNNNNTYNNKTESKTTQPVSNTRSKEAITSTKEEGEKKNLGYINDSEVRRSKPKMDMNPTRRLIHHALGVRMTPPASPKKE
ncbi:hypothetical protein CONCODRAFT_80653 [Conidiobolus coronatus NRRL 28638]|uniref:Uncharacterized protein n=1 Tax=Conidiobolus coronatus (strain ATCC 28846 / CBS 209.66 / NRRL 28638) TaxID=796925 RepID=A0A137NT62_CONC2|nr:hypothetical protein CONCODRAFT_80653 [Conidiobolus coronatus NRRL 28638]|eukprot:KXN65898.1 hypothetical protein CONCODRAFT_80653 [Conidiobolus coronatus NRRL 28638]